MAKYRKLGRTSSQRKALIRNQVTALLHNGKIVTTEAKAKEIRKVAEGLIALAVKEKDNYEEVTVKAKVARKDKDGKRVKEVVDGKKVTVYDEVEKTIKKDMPSRLHARREMLKVLYPVTEVPEKAAGRKKNTKEVDLVEKLFSEIAPKYEDRKGGYTRIVKIGLRKGDAAIRSRIISEHKIKSHKTNQYKEMEEIQRCILSSLFAFWNSKKNDCNYGKKCYTNCII